MASTDNLSDNCNILTWSDELICQNLDYVTTIVRTNLLSDDSECCLQYMTFALENLLHHTARTDAEPLLRLACPVAEEIFCNTLQGVQNVNELDSLSQTQINTFEACNHLLLLCSNILQSFAVALEHFLKDDCIKYNDVESMVSVSNKVAHEALTHYQRCLKLDELGDSLAELFDKSCRLQSLINQFVKKLEFSVKYDEISYLTKLVDELAKRATTLMELKSVVVMIDTWKSFIFMVEKHQDFIKLHLDVTVIVTTLCQSVLKNLNHFISSTHVNFKDALNNLKVSNFLLKIIVKLCKIFGSNVKESFNSLIELLLTLYRCTPSYLRGSGVSQDVLSEVTRHLVIGADPLLSAVYLEPEFPMILERKILTSSKGNPYGSIVMLVSLMKKMNSMKARQMYDDTNVLHLLHILLGACHQPVVAGKLSSPGSAVSAPPSKDVHLYQFVVTTAAVFIFSLSSTEFPGAEDTLIRNVLQTDPWRAMLATDLICLVARYSSAHLCHSIIESLIPAVKKCDLNSARPEFVYLAWLVRRLVPLSDAQYLDSLVQRYPPKSSPWLWRVVGLTNIPDYAGAVESYLEVVQNWTESGRTNPVDFKNMEDGLLAVPSTSNLSDKSLEAVSSLWEVQIPPDPVRWSNEYVRAISSATGAVVSDMPPHHMLKILRLVDNVAARSISNSQKLAILQILENMSAVKIVSEEEETIECLANLFKTILTSDSGVFQTVALKSFVNFAHVTHHSAVIQMTVSANLSLQSNFIDFLNKKLPDAPKIDADGELNDDIFLHECPKVYSDHFNEACEGLMDSHPKRFKLDNGLDVEDSALEDALVRLQKDALLIAEQVSLLDTQQRQLVRSVCCTLNQV